MNTAVDQFDGRLAADRFLRQHLPPFSPPPRVSSLAFRAAHQQDRWYGSQPLSGYETESSGRDWRSESTSSQGWPPAEQKRQTEVRPATLERLQRPPPPPRPPPPALPSTSSSSYRIAAEPPAWRPASAASHRPRIREERRPPPQYPYQTRERSGTESPDQQRRQQDLSESSVVASRRRDVMAHIADHNFRPPRTLQIEENPKADFDRKNRRRKSLSRRLTQIITSPFLAARKAFKSTPIESTSRANSSSSTEKLNSSASEASLRNHHEDQREWKRQPQQQQKHSLGRSASQRVAPSTASRRATPPPPAARSAKNSPVDNGQTSVLKHVSDGRVPFQKGFANTGATCFANALFVAFAHCKAGFILISGSYEDAFRRSCEQLRRSGRSVRDIPLRPALCDLLSQLLHSFFMNESGKKDMTRVIGELRVLLPSMFNGAHQDSCELYQKFLEMLHQETNYGERGDVSLQYPDYEQQQSLTTFALRDKSRNQSPFYECLYMYKHLDQRCTLCPERVTSCYDPMAHTSVHLSEDSVHLRTVVPFDDVGVQRFSMKSYEKFSTSLTVDQLEQRILDHHLVKHINPNHILVCRFNENEGFATLSADRNVPLELLRQKHFAAVQLVDCSRAYVNILVTLGIRGRPGLMGPFVYVAQRNAPFAAAKETFFREMKRNGIISVPSSDDLSFHLMPEWPEDRDLSRERFVISNWHSSGLIDRTEDFFLRHFARLPPVLRFHVIVRANSDRLPLERDPAIQMGDPEAPRSTLAECLEEDTSEMETEQWTCRNRHSCSFFKRTFALTPDVLAVHIMRFKHNTAAMNGCFKLHANLKLPTTLNMSPYMHWNTIDRSEASMQYELVSVVCHLGEHMENGHYIAYARNPMDGLWRCYDDLSVKIVSASEMIEMRRNCYLAFFERSASLRARGVEMRVMPPPK